MNVPNCLSLARLASVPAIFAMACRGTPAWDLAAAAAFAAAAATDWLDGLVARRLGLGSELGKVLDPIADKVLVVGALLALAQCGQLPTPAAWAALAIAAREICVSGMREYMSARGERLPVSRLSKAKTAVQMAAICLLLAGDGGASLCGLADARAAEAGTLLACAAAAMSLGTGWSYAAATARAVSRKASQAA